MQLTNVKIWDDTSSCIVGRTVVWTMLNRYDSECAKFRIQEPTFMLLFIIREVVWTYRLGGSYSSIPGRANAHTHNKKNLDPAFKDSDMWNR
jgi:hypothetical protein